MSEVKGSKGSSKKNKKTQNPQKKETKRAEGKTRVEAKNESDSEYIYDDILFNFFEVSQGEEDEKFSALFDVCSN